MISELFGSAKSISFADYVQYNTQTSPTLYTLLMETISRNLSCTHNYKRLRKIFMFKQPKNKLQINSFTSWNSTAKQSRDNSSCVTPNTLKS